MPNDEHPNSAIRPLVDYIKIQIPCICDQHAETLAIQLIAGLPRLFAEQPEVFSRALTSAGEELTANYYARPKR